MSTKMAEVVLTANGSAVKRILTDLQGSLDGVKNHVDQLKVSIEKNNASRKQMVAQGQKSTQQYKNLVAESRQLNKELQAEEKHMKALNSAMTHNVQETKSLDTVMKNLSGTTTRQLKQALAQANRELQNMSGNSPGLQKMQHNIAAIKGQIEKNNGSLRTHNALWQTAARNIMAYVGVFGAFNFVRGKLQGIMDANLQMSDQLSQIRMVSGLAMQNVRKLSTELNKMDTRTTLTDLQQIAYEGSKLGMGQYGVQGLTSFTEAANKLNVALKEQMGDDTLTYVSKMVETMGMLKKMDIGQAMEKVGSTMFMLSSSSTSTSSNIMEFAKRLTAMSKIAGITVPQLMALASASDSMFLDPEVSATAFVKILQAIPKNAKAIEKQLHLTTGSIKAMVEQGNMMGALTTIFEKMHGQSTSQLAPMFKLLGSEGARMTYVMSAMAQNVDMLQRHVGIANGAFQEGSAVEQEYNLRQETAEGILERANNMWTEAFTSTEGIDTVKSFTQEWYNLSKELINNGWIDKMKISLKMLVGVLKEILILAPQIIEFFLFRSGAALIIKNWGAITLAIQGCIGVIKGSIAAMAGAEAASISLSGGLAAARKAFMALSVTAKANIIGLGITAAILLIQHFTSETKKAISTQEAMNNQMKNFEGTVSDAKEEANGLLDAISAAGRGTKQRMQLIENFNKTYGQYLSKMLTEKSSALDLAQAYYEVNDQLERKMMLEGREDAVKKATKNQLDRQHNLLYNYGSIVADTKGLESKRGFNDKWLAAFTRDEELTGKLKPSTQLRDFIKQTGININNEREKAILSGDKFVFSSDEKMASAAYKYFLQRSAKNKTATVTRNMWNDEMPAEPLTTTQSLSAYSKSGGNKDWLAKFVKEQFAKGLKPSDVSNLVRDMIAPKMSDSKLSTMLKVGGALTTSRGVDRKMGNAVSYIDAAWDDYSQTNQGNFAVVDQPGKTKKTKKGKSRTQELRAELKQTEEDSKALLGKIERWYTLQETSVESAVADGKIMRQDADALIREFERQKNILLGNARYAITGEKNKFKELAKNMDSIATNRSREATDLSDEIKNADTEGTFKVLSKFSGKGIEGVNNGYFMDDTKKKGADNLRDAAKSDAKIAEEVQKINDYFSVIDSAGTTLAKGLEKVGLSFYSAEEIAQQVLGDTATDTKAPTTTGGFATSGKLAGDHSLDGITVTSKRGKPSDHLASAMNEWINNGLDNYKGNPATDAGIEAWFKSWVEDESGKIKEWVKPFGNLMNLDNLMNGQGSGMDFSHSREAFKSQLDVIRGFYSVLMQSEEQYYITLRQKTEKHSKILDTFWKQHGETTNFSNLRRETQQKYNLQKASGITHLGSAGEMGLTSTARYVSENEGVQNAGINVLETRKQYEDAVVRFKGDADLIKEYSDKMIEAEYAYINAMSQAMSSQIDALMKFIEPMKTAAEQVGEMLGTLVTQGQWNADSFKEIMGNMVKSYADMCIQMISDETMRQYKMEHFRQKEKDDTEQHQEDTNNIEEVGQQAKTDIVKTASSQVMGILTGGNKKKKKEEKKSADDSKKIDKDSASSQLKVQDVLQTGLTSVAQTAGQQLVQTHQTQATQNAAIQGQEAKGSVLTSIAEGAGKIIAKLGPWGAPLIAVITALLMGLLNSALSALFGGSSESSKSTVNTKLKTGMLTYDRGNVSSFGGIVRALDGGEVIGTDGNVYHSAASMSSLSTGLITQPTVTMVNGLPSIVGEKGPEMVIGRETTRAMSLNAPGLMRTIVNFDRNYSGRYRPLANGDMGGLDALLGSSPAPSTGTQGTSTGGLDTDTAKQLSTAITQLVGQLQQPIRAEINKYGKGGLVDEVKSGLAFDSKYGGVI